MRWIFISPHLDDAVLSCGGLIWEQVHSGHPVEIWTINAGFPPPGPDSELITRVHAMWRTGTPRETVELRRIEDKNAASRLGASIRHFNQVDCIYRRTDNGELMYTSDVFDPIHPFEASIVEHLAQQLSEELNGADRIVSPLALGGHVDHIITRKALDLLGRPLWYYADIPYLFTHQEELPPAVKAMRANLFGISDPGLSAWQAGIAAYESQISSLFADLQDMRDQIRDYRASGNGLTLWENHQ